jgi:hypothetical protein
MQKHIFSGNVSYIRHFRNSGKQPFSQFGIVDTFKPDNGKEYTSYHSFKAFNGVSEALETAGIKKGALIQVISYQYQVSAWQGKGKVSFNAQDIHTVQNGEGKHNKGGHFVSIVTHEDQPEEVSEE